MFVQTSTLSVGRLDLELGKVSIQYSTEPTNRGVQQVGYFKRTASVVCTMIERRSHPSTLLNVKHLT